MTSSTLSSATTDQIISGSFRAVSRPSPYRPFILPFLFVGSCSICYANSFYEGRIMNTNSDSNDGHQIFWFACIAFHERQATDCAHQLNFFFAPVSMLVAVSMTAAGSLDCTNTAISSREPNFNAWWMVLQTWNYKNKYTKLFARAPSFSSGVAKDFGWPLRRVPVYALLSACLQKGWKASRTFQGAVTKLANCLRVSSTSSKETKCLLQKPFLQSWT